MNNNKVIKNKIKLKYLTKKFKKKFEDSILSSLLLRKKIRKLNFEIGKSGILKFLRRLLKFQKLTE